jgi:carboxylesterase type B
VNSSYAQDRKPAPDLGNVKYGEHERNVFDIWFADKTKKTPLVIYIHGGGFRAGSKEKLNANHLSQLLEAGISVAAINYRYVTMAPLPAAHNDAKRALQFIRSKAGEWNIDKERMGVFGGSAGAQISMWLAFSDDMANPESKNPIERESSRLTCVATSGGQTTMEAGFWQELAEKHLMDAYPSEFLEKIFGDKNEQEQQRMATYGAKTIDEANETAKKLSAMSIVSADDPPIFMSYSMSPNARPPDNPKKVRGWYVHHVDFGIALKNKMDKLNVEAYLKYPGEETKYESLVEFFVDKLSVH